MQFVKTLSCLIIIHVCVQCVYAQPHLSAHEKFQLQIQTDSGLVIQHYYMFNCKNSFFSTESVSDSCEVMFTASPKRLMLITAPKFMTVHGNITYNFFYRSLIDTPFAQSNVVQHQVQTNLSILVKNKYPLRVMISNRTSNSPYFKDATDINLQFNRNALLENIKSNLKAKAIELLDTDVIGRAEQEYRDKSAQADVLQNWLNNPARQRELTEERERLQRMNIPSTPQAALPARLRKGELVDELLAAKKGRFKFEHKKRLDSLHADVATKEQQLIPADSSVIKKYNAKKDELARVEKNIKASGANLNTLKKKILDSVNQIKREINSLTTRPDVYAFMDKNGIKKNELNAAEKLLLSVNQLGIGRTWVDYSELTVKNISLSGINVELNPAPYYFAFAAGKVNYRFRDFIIKDHKSVADQTLYLVRAGLGQKEKNNFIFSFYSGKKALLNSSGVGTPISGHKVLGISIETRIALDKNNYVVAEFAKSSFNNAPGSIPTSSELMSKAFNLRIRTNEAYSLKLFSEHPSTDTRLSGYIKKIGENFQSFNLLPMNVNQDAWMVKINQRLFKKIFVLEAAARKNDFVSPIAGPSFSSKTIFKSIQATFKKNRYPFISGGYYPSSQLSLNTSNVLIENQYNSLNGIVSYNYKYRKTGMSSSAVITKFYNNSNDTGFIYYNASSFTFNQIFYLNRLTLQGSVSTTDQQDIELFSIEQLASFQVNNSFSFGGSLKWNRFNRTENLLGATALLNISVRKLGTIQFNYEKTYLPSYNRKLTPVDIGRMSFYRQF